MKTGTENRRLVKMSRGEERYYNYEFYHEIGSRAEKKKKKKDEHATPSSASKEGEHNV